MRTPTPPEFHLDYCMQIVRHCERWQDLHALPRRQHPVPRTFHRTLEDMVISTTFLVCLALCSCTMKVVTTISHRMLFELGTAEADDCTGWGKEACFGFLFFSFCLSVPL